MGHTSELPERLSEHYDNKVPETMGKDPALVWFTECYTREDAKQLVSKLLTMRDNNDRFLRRMIFRFQRLVRELELAKQ